MPIQTADRMQNARRSYVREILKAASKPEVISFAGGLPNPRLIPVDAIAASIQTTLAEQGPAALQYYTTEGHPPLREWIADQYALAGLSVSPEQVIITTGSQQALDLIGKVLLNPGDRIIVENPTYIAAMQAFGMYQPELCPVALDSDGIDCPQLQSQIDGGVRDGGVRLAYCMPNFQNPTGISYSQERRRKVAEIIGRSGAILVEDDPYGRLRFSGQTLPPIACDLPGQSILLGSFSKIIAPGMRLGWLCAPMELIDKLVIAKQAVDLHSETLGQWVIHDLVTRSDFESHLIAIRQAYGRQCNAMIRAIEKFMPPEVRHTTPDGGMFLWLTLPASISASELFDRAIAKGVAFVPGPAFFAKGGGENMMRLNFSNCDEPRIEEGIRRLAAALREKVES
jgi:2-aminoadipate transaminase